MDRRDEITREMGDDIKGTSIGRHWFSEERGEDQKTFEGFADLTLEEGFDLSFMRKRMQRSFKARGETGYFEFNRPTYDTQYQLPERFSGVI
jgi:hypothetical protein